MDDFKNWERDPANGYLLCSPEHPMPAKAPGQWAHTNPTNVGESHDGECDYYKCDDCGKTWRTCYEG